MSDTNSEYNPTIIVSVALESKIQLHPKPENVTKQHEEKLKNTVSMMPPICFLVDISYVPTCQPFLRLKHS